MNHKILYRQLYALFKSDKVEDSKKPVKALKFYNKREKVHDRAVDRHWLNNPPRPLTKVEKTAKEEVAREKNIAALAAESLWN